MHTREGRISQTLTALIREQLQATRTSCNGSIDHIIGERKSAQELALRAVPGVPFGASGFLLVHVIRMLHIGVQMAHERNEQVSLRMTAHEVSMLKALAALDGISQSDVLRMLMRRDWLSRFGDKMPPKVKR